MRCREHLAGGESVWKKLLLHDFPPPPSSDGDEGKKDLGKKMDTWKEEYQACLSTTWAKPPISNPEFNILRDGTMLLQTNPSFCKAISSRPITTKKQRLTLCINMEAEIALIASPSNEILKDILESMAVKKTFVQYYAKLPGDAICFSSLTSSYVCYAKIDDKRASPLRHARDDHRPFYVIHVDIDRNEKKVTWTRGGEESGKDVVICNCPLPSSGGPVWLVYSNLMGGKAGVRVIPHRDNIDGVSATSLFEFTESEALEAELTLNDLPIPPWLRLPTFGQRNN